MKRKDYVSPEAGEIFVRSDAPFCASSFSTDDKNIPDYEEEDLNW